VHLALVAVKTEQPARKKLAIIVGVVAGVVAVAAIGIGLGVGPSAPKDGPVRDNAIQVAVHF
jgi:hypothetical protein